MSPYSVKIKKEIEESIKMALHESMLEQERTTLDFFSEEALRYIVMRHISKLKLFGSFPNSENDRKRLIFEFNYKKAKTNEATFRPDIASVKVKSLNSRKIEIEEYLLAVELKITKSIDDIKKCKHYVSDRGRFKFHLAICIILPSKQSYGILHNFTKNHFTTAAKSNILLCTVDKEETGARMPVAYWLNG